MCCDLSCQKMSEIKLVEFCSTDLVSSANDIVN